uniref:Uncharacterized protein n=1 Tax=Fagus sylvatica TaxID=28930 RepID=A0A2N9IZ57_FAGSY
MERGSVIVNFVTTRPRFLPADLSIRVWPGSDLNKWVGGLTESGENHARSGEISPNPARSLPDLVRSLQIRRDLARLVRSRLAVLGEIQSALRCSVTSRRCVAVLSDQSALRCGARWRRSTRRGD